MALQLEYRATFIDVVEGPKFLTRYHSLPAFGTVTEDDATIDYVQKLSERAENLCGPSVKQVASLGSLGHSLGLCKRRGKIVFFLLLSRVRFLKDSVNGGDDIKCFVFFPQIELALAIRGSYFKYSGGGSQIFLYSFWGGCRVSGRVSPDVSFWVGGLHLDCKGVSNQHVGVQPTVFRFRYVVIHRLPYSHFCFKCY